MERFIQELKSQGTLDVKHVEFRPTDDEKLRFEVENARRDIPHLAAHH